MPTPKQLYAARLNDAARAYARLEDGTARAVLALLRDLRQDVTDELLAATSPQELQLRQFRQRLDDHIMRFEAQAEAEMQAAIAQAYGLGEGSVVQPLMSLGYRVDPSGGSLLAAVQAQSPDLVRTISGDALKVINLQMRMAALGQIQPLDAMRAITQQFGLKRLSPGRIIVQGVGYNAERILRTELNRTLNLSSHATQQTAQRQVPGLMKRWLATADSRTRKSHLAAHMRYAQAPIPVDQAFEVGNSKLMYPLDPGAPAEETINCILPGQYALAPNLQAASRAFYSGPALKLTVSSGQEIAVTPNHPILTGIGFVAAQFLNVGDCVITSRRSEEIARTIDPNNEHVPAMIEDIWRANFVMSQRRRVVRRAMPHDFYGDGWFMDGNVDIVVPNGLLGGYICNPSLGQHFDEKALGRRLVLQGLLAGDCPGDQLAIATPLATDGIMRGGDVGSDFLWGHSVHAELVGSRPRTWLDPVLQKAAAQNGPRESQLAGERKLRFASHVAVNDGFDVGELDPATVGEYAIGLEDSDDGRCRYAELARDFTGRFAGFIERDNIVAIQPFDFSGHVYDLQCLEQLYSCNGVFVKNCRCTMATVVAEVGVIGTSLDGRIEQALAERNE